MRGTFLRNYFEIEPSAWMGMSFENLFLFLALAAILFCGVEPFLAILVQAKRGTFLWNYFEIEPSAWDEMSFKDFFFFFCSVSFRHFSYFCLCVCVHCTQGKFFLQCIFARPLLNKYRNDGRRGISTVATSTYTTHPVSFYKTPGTRQAQ